MNIPDESLLLKYITGEVTKDEKLQIDSWLRENPDNEKILTQLALIDHAQKTQERIKQRNTDIAYKKVQDRIKGRGRRLFLQRIAVAASLIIGLVGIGSLLIQFLNLKEMYAPSLITVYSNDNSRSQVTLPDGTEVHLNSRSVLTYPSYYQGKERKVSLLEGEAYFKVTPDADRPFIVSVSDDKYKIKVLGTEFNLQAYKDENTISTTLIEGSVQVDIAGRDAETVLKPSEKAIYSLNTNQLLVALTNTDRETDWMYDRLVFKKTPMKEVLARLSRFYNVEFDIKNNIIYGYTFTGTFEDKPLYQVLDYMKISSKIDYRITYKKDENGTKSVVELRR
jgi:ferric-dicitrate binding protein FerR (iron transport regulator)